jgi:orotidine-5'-phosphate decarboxylase
MKREDLIKAIQKNRTYLCVGLDTDITKIPKHLLSLEHPQFEFNKAIIDATAPYAVAYKPNLAFYEANGIKGIRSLEKTSAYLREQYPNHLSIADAKRGDIGNTAELYAKAFFETMAFDAVTLAPYMGQDSVSPFLKYEDKWSIILALTSNESAEDFQYYGAHNGGAYQRNPLFCEVIQKAKSWGNDGNTMFVVGATKEDKFAKIREIVPEHFLLVPGVGAQGGDLREVSKNGMNVECGLLVNSSRGIIYASSGEDFAQAAANEAKKVQIEMAEYLKMYSKL